MFTTLSIILITVLLTTVLAMVERRMVWPYGVPEPGPAYPDQNGYAQFQFLQAMQLGFQLLAWTRDMKGGIYKVTYAFLASPERDCLVIVGVGSIASMPICGTWVYSRDLQGALSYTTDKQSCVEVDISGSTKCQLVPDATFGNLISKHREWLHDRGIMPDPFPVNGEIDEFRNLFIAKRRSMHKMGLIQFTDATQIYWRYSFVGASKLSIANFSVGLIRAVTFGKFPRTA